MKRLLYLLPLLLLCWHPVAVRAQTAPDPTCGLGAAVAFCDTFSQPMGIGSRAGDLNGTVWGVSRATGNENFSSPAFGWAASVNDNCGSPLQVQPENDWRICNGRVVESQDDMGTITNNAAYPKQPFDWSGRTGKAVFDVSNDTGGTHAAWPEFWITNLPVPAPFNPFENGANGAAFWNNAQYAIGLQLGASCAPGQGSNCGTNCPADNTAPVVSISEFQIINNYVATRATLTPQNCVVESPGPNGPLNHYELDVSASDVALYGTDAGSTALKLIEDFPVSVPFTRGFLWIEDVHYNADKFCAEGGACQRVHSFAWDNVGFDGPVLPRDLSYDVLDANAPTGTDAVNDGVVNVSLPTMNLGWFINSTQKANLSTMSVPASAISAASGAVLTFTDYYQTAVGHFLITLNGHAYSFAPPAGTMTFALPLNLADTVAGTNAITIATDGSGANVANVDLKFLGAGGVPACIDPSNCGPAPAPTPAPSPTPTPAPSPSPAPASSGITCPSSTFRVTIVDQQTIQATCS